MVETTPPTVAEPPPPRSMPGQDLDALDAAGALTAHPIVPGFERFHRPLDTGAATVEGGLLLVNELNCVGCHQVPDTWRERLPGRGGKLYDPEVSDGYILVGVESPAAGSRLEPALAVGGGRIKSV